jgi:uncharacterized protein YjiS (DUF1127 family)
MSIYSHQSMTNRHSAGFLTQLSEAVNVWRDRRRQRRELTHWTDRDLHDVGLSWSDVIREAEKPFWRA